MLTPKLNDLPRAKEVFPHVFSPFKVRNLTIPNRIIFGATTTKRGLPDGTMSEELADYYLSMAKGGCGLIFLGAYGVSVDTVSSGFEGALRLEDDRYIERNRELIREIKATGSIAGVQVAHAGRHGLGPGPGYDSIRNPSYKGVKLPIDLTLFKGKPFETELNLRVPLSVLQHALKSTFKKKGIHVNYNLKPMTLDEIRETKEHFVSAMERAADAGAQVIEVHAGHGYLVSTFLSPAVNDRTDEYGGDQKKRSKLVAEIYREARKRIGDKIVFSVRLSFREFIKGGLRPAHYKTIFPILEDAGVDIFNLSVGTTIEAVDRSIPTKELGEAPNENIIAEARKMTDTPFATVGGITRLETAESILRANKADFITLCRALVVDPEMVRKTVEDRESEITRCVKCRTCCFWLTGDDKMYCPHNPTFRD